MLSVRRSSAAGAEIEGSRSGSGVRVWCNNLSAFGERGRQDREEARALWFYGSAVGCEAGLRPAANSKKFQGG